jgi:hypothetical protein
MQTLICFNSICPGKQFAEANIWLATATIVAALQIEKAKDSAGNFITPDAAFAVGFVRYAIFGHLNEGGVLINVCSHPKPFDCMIKPRSENASVLIYQTRVNREH